MQSIVRDIEVKSSFNKLSLGPAALLWQGLPCREVLKADPNQIVIRSVANGLISVFSYEGHPTDMALVYELGDMMHQAEIKTTLGYRKEDPFLVPNTLLEYLVSKGHAVEGFTVSARNVSHLILSFADMAAAVHSGDASEIDRIFTRQLTYLKSRFPEGN